MDIIDKIKEKGVSVDELSKATGIPTSRIYKWFSKKAEPKYADTKLLEDFLNMGIIKPDVTTPKDIPLSDLIEGNKNLSQANKDLAAANLRLTAMLESSKTNLNSQPHIALVLGPYLQRLAAGLVGKSLKDENAIHEEFDRILSSSPVVDIKERR